MKLQFAKVSFAALAMLCILQVSATKRADAQNYYVSTTGSDSNGNGSISQPWATIAHASTQVGAGTVVHVAAGTYHGSFSTYSSGTASAYISYVANTANFSGPVNCAQVAANQGNLSSCVHLVGSIGTTWSNLGDYVAIKGFDVTGPGINGIYTQGNATQISGNHVHDILNSTCNSNGGSGINLNGTNTQVIGNYVHNIGPYPSACGYVQGIYFLQAGGFAYNNITFANSGFGIQLWHFPSNIALVNNTLFNNASGGIVLGTDDSFTVDYITVSNNIVSNNGGVGVSEQGGYSSSTGIHNTYTHNLLYGNTGGDFSLQNGLAASSTVTSAPAFVNYTGTSSGNYQLQSSSPAIGAGSSSGSPTTDFDGNTRPQNGGYDIGSYEYLDPSSAALSVSSSSLGLANTNVGAISPTQTVTLSNKSGSTVSLSGMTITGAGSADFTETNQCGSSLSPGASCVIDVAFHPQAAGTLTATLAISPSSGSPLQVGLSGTGVSSSSGTTVNLSPSSLSFPSTAVGSTSAIDYVTVTNMASSTLRFSSGFAIGGPFAFGGVGTCTLSIAPKASCIISVVFRPTTSGAAHGAVTLKDNVGTQTITLAGSGQ